MRNDDSLLLTLKRKNYVAISMCCLASFFVGSIVYSHKGETERGYKKKEEEKKKEEKKEDIRLLHLLNICSMML
jgi:hypothetical protein